MTIADIISDKKTRLAQEQILVPKPEMKQRAAETERIPLDLRDALKRPGLALVGPILKASPLTQCSHYDFSPVEVARTEQRAGAAALMVATEKTFYQGQESFIGDIRERTRVPIILYDFILEDYQIYAALALGADAVVLNAEILDADMLTRFAALANQLGMQAVVEVHTAEQTERALISGAGIYLIRNLDFNCTGSSELTKTLAPMIPAGDTVISWGGLKTAENLEQAASWGADAACPPMKLFETDPNIGASARGWRPEKH